MHDRPLSSAETIIVFADLQEGIINVGVTNGPPRVRTAAGALADLALAFGLPVVITCVPTTSGTVAPPIAELSTRLPGAQALVRNTADAMDDPPFQTALASSGRQTVVIAGVGTEVAIRLTALAMHRHGYHTIVAVDACTGFDARSEFATFTHLSAAGVELSSTATIAAQLAGDFDSELGRAAMRALASTLAAHGHEHHGDHADESR